MALDYEEAVEHDHVDGLRWQVGSLNGGDEVGGGPVWVSRGEMQLIGAGSVVVKDGFCSLARVEWGRGWSASVCPAAPHEGVRTPCMHCARTVPSI